MRCPGKEAIEALFMSAVKEVHGAIIIMQTCFDLKFHITGHFACTTQSNTQHSYEAWAHWSARPKISIY